MDELRDELWELTVDIPSSCICESSLGIFLSKEFLSVRPYKLLLIRSRL